MEGELIRQHNTHNKDGHGYNLNYGGDFPILSGPANPSYKERKGIPMHKWFTETALINHKNAMKTRHSGIGNSHARCWKITSPNGEIIEINGSLQKFCDEHALPFTTFYSFRGKGIIPPVGPKANRSTEKRHRLVGWQLEQI